MSFFSRLEKQVERVVQGSVAKVFNSPLKPIDIASRLRRTMDDQAAQLSERTVAPNVYTVHVSPEDYSVIEDWGLEALAAEMASEVANHGTSQSYSFVGPVSVSFELTEDRTEGSIDVTARAVQGAVAPVTTTQDSANYPIIDVEGQRYLLTGSVTVIGRGAEADVVVDDSGVSRRHLEIRVTPEGVIAKDLGSTNGCFVQGHKITEATLVDSNVIRIGRTTITFWSSSSAEAY
ncbi:MAG: DUF3662 and FHA domain-containing protein [Actinomycetaceae bacterium]|nr:DUF3662 and FHA domain-containing protein [Actinomycetaceae bacterium]